MALDPTIPDPTGAASARDLERRVEALERANKLLSSTIQGGTLTVQNSAGTVIGELGLLGYGYTGFRLLAADGVTPLFQVDQTQGFGIPWFSTEWTGPTDATNVTSGTFATVWVTVTELLYSVELLFRVTILTDAGTTGEMILMHNGNQIGGTKTVPDNTSAQYEFRIAHGLTIGVGPLAFQLQARRASGAGNFWVYHPKPMHYGSNMTPDPDGWV